MATHRAGVLGGNKFNGKHSTFIKPAEPLIKIVKELDCVSKIVLGRIENKGGGSKHMTIRPAPPAALKVIVSGGGAVQELYVYTSDAPMAEAALRVAWERENR